MNQKFKGKAIYQPEGRAAEYAVWACNFYIGCSNSCTYCYNNRFNWGNIPKLKSCFEDEDHALKVFENELKQNLPELKKHGLFFSFTTDPLLPETVFLTKIASLTALISNVPVTILTKRVDCIGFPVDSYPLRWKKNIAIGFTLTGHDELEPGASTNAERIETMQKLHDVGIKTWASIEPLIDFSSGIDMIVNTMKFCDLYKIGILSGKSYDEKMLKTFVQFVYAMKTKDKKALKIYFKDSLLKQAGIRREDLPENCVDRDYNLFNN